MIGRFLADAFGVCPAHFGVLFCSFARLQIQTSRLLDRVVSGAHFLTGAVFECDIARRRFAAVLCCIRSDVTLCTLSTVIYLYRMCQCGLHAVLRYTYSPPCCRTFQYHRTFIPSQCLCGTIFTTLYSMVCDWSVSRAGSMFFDWPKLLAPFFSSTGFPFSSFFLGWYSGAGVLGLIGRKSFFPSRALPIFFQNNNYNTYALAPKLYANIFFL